MSKQESMGPEDFKRVLRGEWVPSKTKQTSVALGSTKSYHTTLPYPPTANNLHTVVRGRKILSNQGRAYYKAIEAYQPTIGIFAGRLAVTMKVWTPDRRRRDLSNVIKAIEDSMTKAKFWNDDSQIDQLHVHRSGVEKPGRVEVYIQEIA